MRSFFIATIVNNFYPKIGRHCDVILNRLQIISITADAPRVKVNDSLSFQIQSPHHVHLLLALQIQRSSPVPRPYFNGQGYFPAKRMIPPTQFPLSQAELKSYPVNSENWWREQLPDIFNGDCEKAMDLPGEEENQSHYDWDALERLKKYQTPWGTMEADGCRLKKEFLPNMPTYQFLDDISGYIDDFCIHWMKWTRSVKHHVNSPLPKSS
jgi:hypothetical protein